MLSGAGSPGGDELLTVTVVRDEQGYGMKVSGDNPVYVQSVKEQGAAWRAGLRAGDRILRVDSVPVHHHTHQQVVHMIRANASTVLTVHQNTSRHKTPITAPLPVNPEKQRQLEASKAHTVRLMLEKEQKYIRDLKNEMLKVPDVRKQAQLESAELRCSKLQHEIDIIMATQTDNRGSVPVLHVRSQSSPEHLDHGLAGSRCEDKPCPRPPGTPPPPYAHNTQPCADPQRAIISMEEDDSPASDNSTHTGLFSNLRSVRDSKVRTAVLLNWLLGERRCACACLVLVLTDGFRNAVGVNTNTLRRWAYEIHSTFLMPHAVLQLNGVDENMANEIEHVLVNEYEKEELLRNVFRKARQKAKEELSQQLSEFQVKRQVGLATLYGPDDDTLLRCDVDKTQEAAVVERLMCERLHSLCAAPPPVAPSTGGPPPAGLPHGPPHGTPHGPRVANQEAQAVLLAAVAAAALCLHCRPAAVAAALTRWPSGTPGPRGAFLQRDKAYKQRVKQLAKHHPLVVRGHHLQLQALWSLAHCHHCDLVVWGLAPQAYVCTDCKLRVHRSCARSVEEACCLDSEHHNNRISRFMERIHNNQLNSQDSSEKKSKKSSAASHFLNMERSFRKTEEEPPSEQTAILAIAQGESKRDGSADDTAAQEQDVDINDATTKDVPDKENNTRGGGGPRGVLRAESCRERDAPRQPRGKHRNASDPNRLAHHAPDLEPGANKVPSGSSSSSSLSSRSNESNTVTADQQAASQSDWSEEEEPLAAQWADSLPPHILDTLVLSPRLRKRQELIHELIVSEISHVRWLRVLSSVFVRALERAPNLLPPEELRALTPGLAPLREHHARLHTGLRGIRTGHIVSLRAVADVMLTTLGDPSYAPCLARFCRGQRLALDCLRERRRKHKELHHLLTSCEQMPLCGRLQFNDLLACVWQRLTKYQLLLENILKTVTEEDDEPEDDVARLQKALNVAKDVLHTVDTAIRTTENEHKLRTIQSKLEVRAGGSEWEELRRLDLTTRTLRMDGDLTVRVDNKKINVLALMLEDSLVLLQREGDRLLLKPFSQSQQTSLSPLIKWDKVLFRPNAAVRNTFFLMNINGVQMHELSAASAAEYATWVKYIQESPLAKLTELKPNITPSHQATKSNDDSGINVSRNPSDASEKSTSVHRDEECDRDSASDRASADRDTKLEDKIAEKTEGEITEPEKRNVACVGRICTHGTAEAACDVKATVALAATDAFVAQTAFTYHERLRRLDEAISRALRAKSAVIAEILGIPVANVAQMEELAVAEALGQVDICKELQLSRSTSVEQAYDTVDMHQLLLAAQAQANQLTETLAKALTVSDVDAVIARSRRPLPRTCREVRDKDTKGPRDSRVWERCDSCRCPQPTMDMDLRNSPHRIAESVDPRLLDSTASERAFDKNLSEELSAEFDGSKERDGFIVDDDLDLRCSGVLAKQLVEMSCGIQSAVGALVAALPTLDSRLAAARSELAALRDANDALRARRHHVPDYQIEDDTLFPAENVDQNLSDQPTSGG